MTPIVLFVHVHYLETWPALLERIERSVQLPFRLIVTTTQGADDLAPPTTDQLVEFVVIETDNRGRDVLPFLNALKNAGPFEIGLKLHSKRSVHRLDGDAWRDALVGSLLPSAEGVMALFERFEQDRRLGLVAPENSLCSTKRHVGANESLMRALAERMSLQLDDVEAQAPFFCAGTMFWFRRDAFIRVIEADLRDLFVEEAGQTDGTAAHAMERLFASFAEADGYLSLPIDVALSTSASSKDEDLRAAARERLDVDETFVRLPSRLAAFAMSRLRFAVPLYLALPKPVRRVVKATMSGTFALLRK